MLIKSRLAAGLPSLTDRELLATVAAWVEVLENVPTDWINECYKRAMRSRTKSGALQPGELAAIWTEANTTGEVQARMERSGEYVKRPEERCPEFCCSADGLVLVDNTGSPVDLSHDGQTFTRRCPFHHPQGKPEEQKRFDFERFWATRRRAG